MKKIIKLEKPFLLTKDVIFVDVPHYDELKPENVIETCYLKKDKEIWNKLLNFCSELRERKYPKDRTFFYNVLNTIKPQFIDKIVLNAIDNREKKSDIPNEIKVGDFFRDMFTDSMSRIGSKGRVIKELRENHKEKPRKYKGRKKYKIMY